MKGIDLRKTLCGCLVACMIGTGCSGPDNTTYYLDATQGNDLNNGTSEKEAWQSLDRLEEVTLKPGDKVLLKRGEKFVGVMDITAHGTKDAPVTIGAYGHGEQQPVIVATDSVLFAVRILNSDYVTLDGLEIVNHGSTELAARTGVKVESVDYGISKGICLKDLYIHDVNGVMDKWQGGGSGIHIVNGGEKVISIFDGLTIEYCHIARCRRNAMIWDGYSDRSNWHPSLNVHVHHNLIEEVPGDGIVPIGCDGALIEYNVMRHGVEGMAISNREAAAGMWPWACDNTVIRYNESANHKAPWDGQGFDADYNCKGTVIEYNYSHDNYGGMVLVCSSGDEDKTTYCVGNENPIVRYNISIGDGNRPYPPRGKMFSPTIHIAGPVRGTQIYRNILCNQKKAAPDVDRSMLIADDWAGLAENTLIKENIFYTPEESRFDMSGTTGNVIEGNCYLGSFIPMLDEKEPRNLAPEYVMMMENAGKGGLSVLMDSVEIAGGAKCVYVSKDKIEDFFEKMTGK